MNIIRTLLAASILAAATPVQATTVTLDTDRMNLIEEVAKNVCRSALDSGGKAVERIEKLTGYLNLTQDEQAFLLSLCILYAHGRLDQIDRQQSSQ